MTTVHLIYPHDRSKISCPDAIGWQLGERLARRYRVLYYNWNEFRRIQPHPGDVLVGHACPLYFTIFRRSLRRRGWKRVIMLSPHCHGDDFQPAYNDSLIPDCDLYLAITGNYWFQDIPNSGYAHWLPKMRHMDLAVDRNDFPPIKTQFQPPGQRKFVYLGSSAWYKNTAYLSQIAQALPAGQVSWIGVNDDLEAIRALGRHDFRQRSSQQLIAEHDFLLTVGNADGNPTSILEAMAWGLIPVCSKESGYEGFTGIRNIPLNDLPAALRVLEDLQEAPESQLLAWQRENWKLLDEHFNWDRFASQVVDAIESTDSPAIGRASLQRRAKILRAELTTPFWRDALDPRKLRRRLSKLQSVPLPKASRV